LLSIIFNPELNVVSFGTAFVSFFAGAGLGLEGSAFGASALDVSAGLGGSGGGVGLTGSAVAGAGSDFAGSVFSYPDELDGLDEQLDTKNTPATTSIRMLLFIGRRVYRKRTKTESVLCDNISVAEISFIADVMVGKLARWLRVLGIDVIYSNKLEDEEILTIAIAENRIILTRDVAFAAHCGKAYPLVFVEHNDWRSQLQQVVNAYDLKDFKILSRCIECNSSLDGIDKESIAERVPPYVYQTQHRFSLCRSCDHIYWRGTHVDAILQQIADVRCLLH
jgi:uncharacterized protein with PIN domain